MKDVTSKRNLRGLANAMGVAAFVGAPVGHSGDLSLNGLAEHFHNNMVQEVAQVGVDAAQGKNVGKDIGERFINVAVNSASAHAANWIGKLYEKGKLNYLEQKVAHFVVGAAQGAALDPNNPKGALFAGAAAVSAEALAEGIQSLKGNGTEISQLILQR